MTSKKPLGTKAYGSIPHLPGSRMGPAEKTIHPGQARIATEKTRDGKDRVLITEKLDGSCCAVARIGENLFPLGRAGYLAQTSPHTQHRLFASWVYENYDRFMFILDDGERAVGEWLAQAHGTVYNLEHEPFVIFDIMKGTDRLSFWEMIIRLDYRFFTPHLIHLGPTTPEKAMEDLGEFGRHGALDPIEGVVYRVERDGKFDFMCKYVRPDKEDGKYFPEISGQPEVWNWYPEKIDKMLKEAGELDD